MPARIRVLIADDSKTLRGALATLLSEDPDIDVIGQAADGVEAVTMARNLRPDVITMDILMPRLDGLGAISAIMASTPARILVISSVTEDDQLDLAFRAMASGALELINKPISGQPNDIRGWGKRVCDSVKLMAEVPVVSRPSKGKESLPAATAQSRVVDIFGIAASTGGPPALATILTELPEDLPFPVLIAQHMAPGFMTGMVRWLQPMTKLEIVIVTDTAFSVPRKIYIPIDGHDLELGYGGKVTATKTKGGNCPSADRMFESMAQTMGRRAGGAVLTGMGEDGAVGLLAIRNAGGVTIAQDAATSLVFGMPKAAIANGAAREVLPLKAMGGFIRGLRSERAAGAATFPKGPRP